MTPFLLAEDVFWHASAEAAVWRPGDVIPRDVHQYLSAHAVTHGLHGQTISATFAESVYPKRRWLAEIADETWSGYRHRCCE